jgi:hypothetical protein
VTVDNGDVSDLMIVVTGSQLSNEMQSVWRSIVLVPILGSGAFSDLHSQSAHPPFMVGVLQSDGVLIPVARFEAGSGRRPGQRVMGMRRLPSPRFLIPGGRVSQAAHGARLYPGAREH